MGDIFGEGCRKRMRLDFREGFKCKFSKSEFYFFG